MGQGSRLPQALAGEALKRPSRHTAQRFSGSHMLAGWLPEADYATRLANRGGELPSIQEIAELTAKLVSENINSEIEVEFRDETGFDGQKISFDDGETAEMGSHYISCSLYDDDRRLWGYMENLRACYLWPAARALIRALDRPTKARMAAFMRPTKEYLPLNTITSFTAVFNAVCVRASEYVHEDHGQAVLLDTLCGVKGHLARIHDV